MTYGSGGLRARAHLLRPVHERRDELVGQGRASNGGATWSAEKDLSTYVGGFSYIQPGGFGYPFGDYFEMDIDDRGDTHAVWGEGLDYQTPGSIWYTRGR